MNLDIPDVYLRNRKFIVVADERTGEDLAIFFDHTLPDMHIELLNKARERWAKIGVRILAHGGGRFSVINNMVVFFGQSSNYGRFEDDVVLKLAPQHQYFEAKKYNFLSKAGADDAYVVLKQFGVK
jgi:hypothetical protein